MHLPVHAIPTTKSAAEQRTCYLPPIEFCTNRYDKWFCDNTDKSGHMEYGGRFENRNGLLGLLHCVCDNIQIHAFDT